MKTPLLLLLTTLFLCLPASAQTEPSQLRGRVIDHRTGKGVANLELDPSNGEPGQRTDKNGYFTLRKFYVGPGRETTILLKSSYWAIYQPFAGRFTTQKTDNHALQTIRVLPKGAPEFLAPEQFVLVAREVVRRLSLIPSLQAEKKRLTAEVETKDRALTEASNSLADLQAKVARLEVLAEYAERTGHLFKNVEEEYNRWVKTRYEGDEKKKESFRLLLSGDIEGASAVATEALEKGFEADNLLNAAVRKITVERIRDDFDAVPVAVQAPQLKGDWAAVISIYEKFDLRIKAIPNFKEVLGSEWGRLRIYFIMAKRGMAVSSKTPERSRLLSEALFHCEEATTIYKPKTDPAEWGVVQLLRGYVRFEMAFDLRGAERKQAFTDASADLESVLKLDETVANSDCEQCLSAIKVLAGLMAAAGGSLLGGPEGNRLSKEGVKELEKSISDFQHGSIPLKPAERHLIVGVSQTILGELPGKAGIEYLKLAKDSLDKALSGKDAVVGANRFYAISARTNVLLDLGQRTGGQESLDHLKALLAQSDSLLSLCDNAESSSNCSSSTSALLLAIMTLPEKGETPAAAEAAMASFIDALERRLKALPNSGSTSDVRLVIQNALGTALMQSGAKGSDEGIANVWVGIEHLEQVLLLSPKEASRERAFTELQILSHLFIVGRRVGLDRVAAKYDEHVARLELLLEDQTHWQFSGARDMADIHLANSLRMLGQQLGGQEGRQKLESAVKRLETILNRTANDPGSKEWVEVNVALGDSLLALASMFPPEQNREQTDDALKAYERALTVLTPTVDTPKWMHVRSRVAHTKLGLAMQLPGEKWRDEAQTALQTLSETVTAIDKGSNPIQWGMAHGSVGRAQLTISSRQSTPEEARAELSRAVTSFEQALSVQYSGDSVVTWAEILTDYGRALSSLANIEGGNEGQRNHAKAIDAYQQALTLPVAKVGVIPRALTQLNLAHSLSTLGTWEGYPTGEKRLQQAVNHFDEALSKLPVNPDWARAQDELGHTHYLIAQAPGPNQAVHAAAAIKAHDQAISFYSQYGFREQWARTNGELGNALTLAGWLSAGSERVGHWKRAVEAYNHVLEIYKPDYGAGYWAQANLNLGDTFLALGTVKGPEENYLKSAIQAFEKAVSIYQSPGFEAALIDAKNGLGDVHFQLKQATPAAKYFEEVLAVDPKNPRALSGLAGVHHEFTYNYAEALRLQLMVVEIDPKNLSAQANLAEDYFSAAKPAECEKLVAELLAHPDVDRPTRVAMRVIRIANTIALGHTTRVPEQMDLLIAEVETQPADFQLYWWFQGTKHSIAQQKNLSGRKKWFSLLFRALEANNRTAIVQRLREVKAAYKQ